MKKPNINSLFLIIAAIVVLGGLYWYFFSGPAEQPTLSSGVVQDRAQVQFETLIGQLEPITFNSAVLSDARFTALVDLATPVTPEPAGRLDPFAPIPGVSVK